jgi:hypothetical protein
MPRRKCLFRGTEVTRAVRAAEKANQRVARVEIDQTGKIILILGDAGETAPINNEWDEAVK